MKTGIEIKNRLIEKIESRKAKIVVIGLGYVGLPLAIEFARNEFEVVGIEIDRRKIEQLNGGINYLVSDKAKLHEIIGKDKLRATSDYKCLSDADCICICVPTPLDRHREPDMKYVVDAAERVSSHLKRGQLVILESTTYPGTTDGLILPILEKSGLEVGSDFFLAFSPERIDPGNPDHNIHNTPRVVGGTTQNCSETVITLYSKIISKVYKASSTQVAEMEKLYENIFRAVNIALVNELALLCKKMDIDIWEVIELAKTKPYGFLPFYPGPGLGGHCIPIDPFYLTWKAREYDFNTRFIELAGEINTKMPYEISQMIIESLSSQGKCIKGAKIMILGVAYKKDIADYRESSSLKLLEILQGKEANVNYNDPHIHRVPTNGHFIESTSLNDLGEYDCVVIATDHSLYDYDKILEESKLIVDTRNALKIRGNSKVVTL
ncbi:MAG: nucleotide sugar dehydrogenase [Candidatus Eremiobacteraeota bacterium]|nr:nucleotide sugar dehydrogenase [Candidatus Eremiobacteraeota bacterium]